MSNLIRHAAKGRLLKDHKIYLATDPETHSSTHFQVVRNEQSAHGLPYSRGEFRPLGIGDLWSPYTKIPRG